MSFTERRLSTIIGTGDFIHGKLVFCEDEFTPASEGWDTLLERYAIRRAVVTAADAAAMFPTGTQRPDSSWWVTTARPIQVSPGVWKIEVSYKGWAGTKPRLYRGGVADSTQMVPLETDLSGATIKWGFSSQIYVQYVVASHEEIDDVRAGIIADFDGAEMAAAFPISGAALKNYEDALAAWQVLYDLWYESAERTNYLTWEVAYAEWAAARPEYLGLLEVYYNSVEEWRAAYAAWDAGRPAEIRAQEAWDAADALFDIRHAQWTASSAANILTAQVVQSGQVYFAASSGPGYVEQATASEDSTAVVTVNYTTAGTPLTVTLNAAITAGMTKQAAAVAIAAAINANGTLNALFTAAAAQPGSGVVGYEPWCVQLTRNTTAANDASLQVSFVGGNGLLNSFYTRIIVSQGPTRTIVYGIGTVVAEPVWTGGTRPSVTTAETAAPVAPTAPAFPDAPPRPEVSVAPEAPPYPTFRYGLVDSKNERLPGSPATLVTDTFNQLIS